MNRRKTRIAIVEGTQTIMNHGRLLWNLSLCVVGAARDAVAWTVRSFAGWLLFPTAKVVDEEEAQQRV